MTNAELNLAIAKLRYPNENPQMEIELYGNLSDAVIVDISGLREDYCNNWNDLMPLIVELGVNYVLTAGNKKPFWIATHRRYGNVEAVDLSEQALKVALAKCALKVLEAKQ